MVNTVALCHSKKKFLLFAKASLLLVVQELQHPCPTEIHPTRYNRKVEMVNCEIASVPDRIQIEAEWTDNGREDDHPHVVRN